MISLLTMGQGNMKALVRTIESFKGICNEIVFGDMLVFDDDREELKRIAANYNMRIIKMDFNFTFKWGFAATLNRLASFTTNDLVLYMNVSEVIDKNLDVNLISPQYSGYYFNHATEQHKWLRCYNKNHFYWSGVIHEIPIPFGGVQPVTCPEPLFMMADTEKDMEDTFKAKVFNDIKELVYFNQYVKLVECIEVCGAVNFGWVKHAQADYDSFRERLNGKGVRFHAFRKGYLEMYLQDVFTNSSFDKERQESSRMVNLQGLRKDIL